MKSDIKTIYLDSLGRQHETKGGAAKANRLIYAARKFTDATGLDSIAHLLPRCDDGGVDEHGQDIIEYARAVVAIHGMKDGK